MSIQYPLDKRFDGKINTCSDIGYFFLLLLFLDFLCFGSGIITQIYSFISTREIFFCLVILFSLPLIWKQKKEIFSYLPFLFVLFFLLLVIINAVRGVIFENSLSIILSDLTGFSYFFILPSALVLLYNKERFEFLMKFILIISCVFAIASLVLSYYYFFPQPFSDKLYDFFEANTLCSLTSTAGNGTRVFFHTTSRYILPALLFSVYFAFKERHFVFYGSIMALMGAALFITYSRAIVLGAVLGILLIILIVAFCFRDIIKKLMVFLMAVLLGSCSVLFVLGLTQDFSPFHMMISRVSIAGESLSATSETLVSKNTSPFENASGTDHFSFDADAYIDRNVEQESLDKRDIKMEQLGELISEHLVLGNGLGAAIAFDDGFVEYFYHDVIAKMGIIGLLFYFLPFFYLTVWFFKKGFFRGSLLGNIFWVTVCYCAFISYFNPCLNSVAGISCYVLFISACFNMDKLYSEWNVLY